MSLGMLYGVKDSFIYKIQMVISLQCQSRKKRLTLFVIAKQSQATNSPYSQQAHIDNKLSCCDRCLMITVTKTVPVGKEKFLDVRGRISTE